ncbi:MAG: winged helix-turn-helix domain-containing protein [Candidatus Saliniplasma sp.]
MNHKVQTVDDMDRIKLSLEKTREKILALLRVNDMSISQIAEVLNKDQSTINRHIKKLERAGFVEVIGERKESHIPEKIYGRTAEAFLINPDSDNIKNLASLMINWNLGYDQNTLEKLEMMGFTNNISRETLTNLLDFLNMMNEHLSSKVDEIEEGILEMNYRDLIKLKLVLYLIEIEKQPELEKYISNVFSDFEGKIAWEDG